VPTRALHADSSSAAPEASTKRRRPITG